MKTALPMLRLSSVFSRFFLVNEGENIFGGRMDVKVWPLHGPHPHEFHL
jgi:hypothetical protein